MHLIAAIIDELHGGHHRWIIKGFSFRMLLKDFKWETLTTCNLTPIESQPLRFSWISLVRCSSPDRSVQLYLWCNILNDHLKSFWIIEAIKTEKNQFKKSNNFLINEMIALGAAQYLEDGNRKTKEDLKIVFNECKPLRRRVETGKRTSKWKQVAPRKGWTSGWAFKKIIENKDL